MVAIIQKSRKQIGARCRTTIADKRKRKNARRSSAGKQHASIVNAISSPEYTKSIAPSALAGAVNSVLRVSRQQPYRNFLAATLMSTGAIAQAQGFPASINLQDLDGSNGFVINGIDINDASGNSVSSAGDINGDGVDDVIIGAANADSNGVNGTGESYVVFGGAGVGSSGSLDLSSLDGVSGFVINSTNEFGELGRSVSSAGDINDDGVDDVILGAPGGISDQNVLSESSYVVFGGTGMASGGSLNLADLDGVNGFVINSIDGYNRAGESISGAGDINGDGIDDVIIGAPDADPSGAYNAGESYVVFGGRDVGSGGSLNLSGLDGVNGFVINGVDDYNHSGESVSGVGDINGDGVGDVIIAARNYGINTASKSYVVFGGNNVGRGGSLNLSSLDGVNGFVINATVQFESSNLSVSGAGDINGDGVNDVIIGDRLASPNGVIYAGESYVVFGGADVGSGGSLNVSDLDGVNGFVIAGIDQYDQSGISVSGAGDINGDGFADVIIGSSESDEYNPGAGTSYVVFGGASFVDSSSVDLSSLDGDDGFVINGINLYESFGSSVSSAGDINGDGIADIIIGAPSGRPNDVFLAGESYVVFGVRDTPITPTPTPDGPDNDQFENARFLDSANKALTSELTLAVKGTTVNATAQSGEPAHFQGGFGLPPGPENSIWYQWTPEADQVVEVDTAGSAVSTVLVAYTGDTLSGLQEIATGIDNVREVSRIRFAVRAGETYHFAIDGYEDISEGTVQLNLRQPRLDPSECTIKGTNGSDNLVGTLGPDVICALGGDDFIKALGGDDIIFAGKGSDLSAQMVITILSLARKATM